jgi:hypothetical protein
MWTAIGLWSLFYAGFAANLLRQAQTSVSSSSNSLGSVWDWFKLHWHVAVWRLVLSVVFSPIIIRNIPASLDLPQWSVYGAAGFIADNLLDSILFIFGQKLGTKVEVPQVAPPTVGSPTK